MIARVHDDGGPFVRNNGMGWGTGVLSALGGGRWTASWWELVGIGAQQGRGWLRLGCGLAGRLAGWLVPTKGGCSLTGCQVLTMRMDGPGWRGREGKSGQGNRRRRRASKKLSTRWINPDEGDDIAASKFLCGGAGRWWQLDNKGGGVAARVWVAGTRYLGTTAPAHDIDMEGAGGQVPTSSLWYTGTYRPD